MTPRKDRTMSNLNPPAKSEDQKSSAGEGVIAPKELKELRRVFGLLCFYSDKKSVKERLQPIRDQLSKLEELEASEEGFSANDNEKQTEVQKLRLEEKQLEQELRSIQNRSVQHIRGQDTAAALKTLGRAVPKKEVLDMMWEVDEKVDGVIDWDEFHLMFERNVRDTTGLEPARFYYLVQFLIYDRNGNGSVSLDETMNLLYARLGREKMESTITELFGGDDGTPIVEQGEQGGEITFNRYWEVVEKKQIKMFQESELGRTLAERKMKKVDPNRKK